MKEKPLLLVIDGLDGRQISAHQLTVGANLSEEIIKISPDKFGGKAIYVYQNSVSPENEIPLNEVPSIFVLKDDFFIVRATPAQQAIVPVLTAAALATAVYFTAGIGAALLVGGISLASGLAVGLITSPKMPSGETSRDQATGLNVIGAPHNVARIGSRVAEIFGQMRIWPDLAIPAIEDWSGRTQKVTCLYCIGIGYYQTSNFKLNETPISALPGVSATLYGPNSTMPVFIIARESETQQQISLEAPADTGGDFSAWVNAVGDKLVQLWIEIGFTSGLVVYKSSGGTRDETTHVRVEYQRTDIAGEPILTHDFTYTAATGNPLRYTSKITGLTPGAYRCRARRLDDGTHGDDDVHVSNVALVKVIGIENLPSNSRDTHTNTFIYLSIDNNDQVAQLSALTFNLIVKRMLHIVQSDGTIYGFFDATSFMKDALYYVLHDPALGNFFTADIDMDGLYDLHATLKTLDSGQGAEFNGVFDRWTSVDEMAQTIAQVGRAGVVYDGGRIIFMRDEDKITPMSVFNRRVRPAEDESTRQMTFLTPDEADGVSIDWKDSTKGYVDRTYIFPPTAVNPKTINLLGVTHWSQVYRRALYEWNRIKYRRRTARITVTEEGLLCNPLDIVTVIDPWLDPITDGDVLDYDPVSRTVTIDQNVAPSPGRIMRLRSIEGDLTDDVPIVAGKLPTNRIRLTRNPVFAIKARDFKHQVGNLYVIATVAYLDEHDWHVIDVQPRDRKQVELNLVEYAAVVFTCDTVNLPTPPVLQ